MMKRQAEVIVAGHICLDVIPDFSGHKHATQGTNSDGRGLRLNPGALLEIGPATISTGGAVANTGLALHQLGVRVSLRGKVGDDLWGRAILDRLEQEAPRLSSDMI